MLVFVIKVDYLFGDLKKMQIANLFVCMCISLSGYLYYIRILMYISYSL